VTATIDTTQKAYGGQPIASAPQGNFVTISSTSYSWSQVTLPQDVGDVAARARSREAGARAVRKYEDTLRRLAND
jgi:hypothetical protein